MNTSTCQLHPTSTAVAAIGPAIRDLNRHDDTHNQNQNQNQNQNHPNSGHAGSDGARDGGGDGDLQVLQPAPITLEDHTVTPGENSPGLWARSARVVDYTIVSGTSRTGLKRGAFVSWNCSIQTLEVPSPAPPTGLPTMD